MMQILWNNVVKLCPMWLAPNAITLIGLIVNMSGALLAFYYCPTATEEAPRWVWAWNAFSLFFYQTLDAIDGKQARRTGTSSPLGELFDHGMDSISMFLVMNSQLCALKAGNEPLAYVIAVIVGCTGFYNAHWMTYITGKLEFGFFDVTEAQWATISIFMSTYYFGQDVWSYVILFWPLRVFIFYIPLLALFANQMLVQYNKITSGGAGPNGSTIAGTSVLSPLSNILLILFICYLFIQSKSSLLNNHPVLFSLYSAFKNFSPAPKVGHFLVKTSPKGGKEILKNRFFGRKFHTKSLKNDQIEEVGSKFVNALYFGVTFAKVSNCLIVAHMSKYEIQTNLNYFICMGFGIYLSNQWLSRFVNGYWVLWTCFLYVCVDLRVKVVKIRI